VLFEIKHRFNGSVLFKLETESLKLCVEAAVKSGADLRGAYLEGADLEGADLEGADLEGADLRGADLRGADLRGAYLEGADLRGADLRGADLRGAYLEGADLRGADLRGAYLEDKDNSILDIKQIGNIGFRGDYTIGFKCENSIQIKCGCWFGTIDEFAERVEEVHGDSKYGNEYLAAIQFFKTVFA